MVLCKINPVNHICNQKQTKEKDRSLQANVADSQPYLLLQGTACDTSSSRADGKGLKGSLTVEAAAVVPVFLLAVLQLFSLFGVFSIQTRLLSALHQSSKELAVYGFAEEILSDYDIEVPDGVREIVFTQGYVRLKISSYIGKEQINNSVLTWGLWGISLGQSEILNNNMVDIVATYEMNPVVSLIPWHMMGITRARVRVWNGYDNAGNAGSTGRYVYITEYGEVYHLKKDCPHLNIKVDTVKGYEIDDLYNNSGQRYGNCSLCTQRAIEQDFNYYITKEGNCYHGEPDCTGLVRRVQMVLLDKVTLPCCSKCFSQEGN